MRRRNRWSLATRAGGAVTAFLAALVVHGDQDTVVPAGTDANVDALPDARVVVVQDAGHMGFVEHPERYVEIVDTFLATLR